MSIPTQEPESPPHRPLSNNPRPYLLWSDYSRRSKDKEEGETCIKTQQSNSSSTYNQRFQIGKGFNELPSPFPNGLLVRSTTKNGELFRFCVCFHEAERPHQMFQCAPFWEIACINQILPQNADHWWGTTVTGAKIRVFLTRRPFLPWVFPQPKTSRMYHDVFHVWLPSFKLPRLSFWMRWIVGYGDCCCCYAWCHSVWLPSIVSPTTLPLPAQFIIIHGAVFLLQ